MKCAEGYSKIIILVPYPAQGHVTPMLKLAKSFLSQGFQPLLVTPDYIHSQIARQIEPETDILCASIPDGIDEKRPRDFFAIEEAMEKHMPVHLERLIVGELGEGAVAFMVVDLLASWAIEVGRRCRLPVAGFWPVMLAAYHLIFAIPDMVRSGLISDTGSPQHMSGVLYLPNQPVLSTEELPWLIGTQAARNARFKFWTRTLSRSTTLKWVLVNSFPDEFLNEEHQHQPTNTSPDLPLVLPIGPLGSPSTAKNPTFWQEDTSCLHWLDKQKPNSVIYISFGSWVSPIGESKIRSLAMALESLGHFFIWVLGTSWRTGLPHGFEERVGEKGKIVSWAPQMEVLKHKSVGVYLTHCGWNSTVEAVQCQKRMLCYPIAGDQFLNCNYIVRVWKIGVKISGFGKKDVEDGLRKLAEDKEMGPRLRKLRERTMGDKAVFRARANLRAFADFLEKQTVLIGSSVDDDNDDVEGIISF